MDSFWDSKWIGESRINDDIWTCEVAISFTSIRFKDGTKQWNFKSYRFDAQANENSTHVQIPQNQFIMNLGYSIPVEFELLLKKSMQKFI